MIEEGQSIFYLSYFVLAVALVVFFVRLRSKESVTITTKEFKQFQASYITSFSAVLFCELLASASFYHSFVYLGLSIDQIARLYVVSVLSSAIFSIVFEVVDMFSSRRDKCVSSCFLYAISMFSLFLGPHYEMLLFGRVLYGAASALQQIGFEAYGAHEHSNRGFPDDWMSQTASYFTHSMALVAALTGLLGQSSSTSGPLGCIGLCCSVFILAAIYILFTWNKDINHQKFAVSPYVANLVRVVSTARTHPSFAWFLVMSASFESFIMLFTFYWAPWLTSLLPYTNSRLPFELIFSCLVMASMLGNYVYQWLLSSDSRLQVDSIFQYTLLACAISLFTGSIVNTLSLSFLIGLIVQACIGVYWPSIGMLRGSVVLPELRNHTLALTRYDKSCMYCMSSICLSCCLVCRLLTAGMTFLCFYWISMHKSSFAVLSICGLLTSLATYAHSKVTQVSS